jgi:hypothetical protein
MAMFMRDALSGDMTGAYRFRSSLRFLRSEARARLHKRPPSEGNHPLKRVTDIPCSRLIYCIGSQAIYFCCQTTKELKGLCGRQPEGAHPASDLSQYHLCSQCPGHIPEPQLLLEGHYLPKPGVGHGLSGNGRAWPGRFCDLVGAYLPG